MTFEIGLLFTGIAGIIGAATFFIGRQSAAKNDGQEWGELKSDIRHIKDDLTEIKISSVESSKAAMTAIAKETNDRKESVRRLHDRLDEHVNAYHSGG